ncbi:helix-turn-helix domain-containing protein [Streptococcus uberis]|uniref:helix-turn-helix domain-containing protein n=1 Tax=Streptococcus uberis TaxID=1349 RepID=UPI0020BFA346|nr:helix-turn-helix transcriptional regulator [Streptococcus uberis]
MNRLKELREKNSLTQQELADKIGVSKRTLGYWEKGEVQIKPDKVKKLAEVFNISIPEFLGYQDNIKAIEEASQRANNHLKKAIENSDAQVQNFYFLLDDSKEFITNLIKDFETELGENSTIIHLLKEYKKRIYDLDSFAKALIESKDIVIRGISLQSELEKLEKEVKTKWNSF